MTSSTEEAPAGHVTGGDALNDEAQSLLIGCVDDLTSAVSYTHLTLPTIYSV